MKKTLLSIALTSLLASTAVVSTAASASIDVSGNVGVTTNYLWRGVTQKSDHPALSGGIDFSHESGAYVGAWGSQADWAEDMTVEFDYYAGYAGEIKDTKFSYDVGYIYYAYPDAAEDVDFSEVYAGVTYDFFTLTVSTSSPDHGSAEFGDDTYVSTSSEFELIDGIDLGLHVGNYFLDEGENYRDYSFSLSTLGFTFTVSDTNLAGDDGHVNAVLSYGVEF